MQFTFFESYYKALKTLSSEQKHEVFDAMMEFMFEDIEHDFTDETASGFWELMRPTLNKSKEQSKRKSGKKKPNKNQTKTKTKPDENQTKTDQQPTPPKESRKVGKLEEEKDIELRSVVSAWNGLQEIGVQSIKSLTDTRRKKVLSRIKDNGLSEVVNTINRIRGSSFLRGENGSGWKVTFDWFIEPRNFQKVLEGNYDDKGEKLNGNGAPEGWAADHDKLWGYT